MIAVGRENSTAIELSYEDHGAGVPVVLVHGFPLASEAWERQIPALLEEGHRVVAYDRRGFGRSSRPADGAGYDAFASDLNVLMTALDLHQAVLVGHSLGTGDIMRYLRLYGSKRVSRVALLAPLPPARLHSDKNAKSHCPSDDRYSWLSRLIADYYNLDALLGARVSEEAVRYAWDAAARDAPRAARYFTDAQESDFGADLVGIGVPVLLVSAGADRLLPQAAGAIAAYLPISKVIEISHAPHGMLWTHAAEVNAALLEFIDA